MQRYDAFVLVSFGGPEGPDDVMPFLRNVTAGRNVPDSRLAQVAEHYYRFGGVSPINQQCRELLAAVRRQFAADGIDLPVYWGNRNWQPYLSQTMRQLAADGIGHALAFATSAYSSYSGCRQYLEDIDRARSAAGLRPPALTKIVPYFDRPEFISAFTAATRDALGTLPADVREGADLVFTAHSVPETMAAASGPAGGAYPAQLGWVAGQVAARLGRPSWRLAYSSRSGPPAVPWLEPDVSDCLTELAKAGSPAAVVVPIGFVSDHMEVIFDLDVEARETADRLGLPMARAATPGAGPAFVSMISALVTEYQSGGPAPAARAGIPADLICCAEQCCAPAVGGRARQAAASS